MTKHRSCSVLRRAPLVPGLLWTPSCRVELRAHQHHPGHTQGHWRGAHQFRGLQPLAGNSELSQYPTSGDGSKHLYLMIIEVAINRKPVSFCFCPGNRREPGPTPQSHHGAASPGQGSTVLVLLAPGCQCAAFVTGITWTGKPDELLYPHCQNPTARSLWMEGFNYYHYYHHHLYY